MFSRGSQGFRNAICALRSPNLSINNPDMLSNTVAKVNCDQKGSLYLREETLFLSFIFFPLCTFSSLCLTFFLFLQGLSVKVHRNVEVLLQLRIQSLEISPVVTSHEETRRGKTFGCTILPACPLTVDRHCFSSPVGLTPTHPE